MSIGADSVCWSPVAVARVMASFASAAEACLFGTDPTRVTAVVGEREQNGVSYAVWEARFPRMPPEAFGVLGRMARASIPGVRRFELAEHAPEPVLVVRSFDSETEATIADVAFRIGMTEGRAPRVRLVFHDAVTEAVLERARALLHTWADVVSLGGFHGPSGMPRSRAALLHVRRVHAQEVVATFDDLATAHEGIEALFQGLLRVDEIAAIALVEIAGQRR